MTIQNVKILISATTVLAALVIILFIKPDKIEAPTVYIDNNETSQAAVKQVPEASRAVDYEYSRLTLFNARPAKVSLAIPVHWDGYYRAREDQDKAVLYYIGEGKEEPIMEVRLLLDKEISDLHTQEILGAKKGAYLAFYRLYPLTQDNSENKIKNTIFQDAALVAGSIKIK